jgi:2-dehydro-3-deoxygluconokinase
MVTYSPLMVAGLRGNRIVFFGELLIRLSPPNRALLQQARSLDVHVGGAEANVAVGLANLGHETAMVSVIPDNALGRAALSAIRAQGVDCRSVQTLEGRDGRRGRMGLYFLEQGAGARASEIVYDRRGSAFAFATEKDFDWPALLSGSTRLHLSGITPALGPESARAALTAAQCAKSLGVPISFDGNFRETLWREWDGNPKLILAELFSYADILFGNHRDISLVLGKTFSGDGPARRREAAMAAFAAFSHLNMIASTSRDVQSADCHRISARIDTRAGFAQTDDVAVEGIVDRIGAGDAFAAGVLHAMFSGGDIEQMATTGLALTCLKHTLPGDASLFRQSDIDAFHASNMDVRR